MVPQKETPKVYPVSAVTKAIADQTGLTQAPDQDDTRCLLRVYEEGRR